MLKRVLCKMAEIGVIAGIVLAALLVITGGASEELQAGVTADGDPCTSTAGDANGDDAVTIVDALNILQYLFLGGDEPVAVCEAGTSVFDDDLVEKIEDFFSHVTIEDVEDVEDDTITYRTIKFTDCNIQLVNGLGATNGDPDAPTAWSTPEDAIVNGLGNLIIGYNELRNDDTDEYLDFRTGSHNLILGIQQSYSSVGGLLAGRKNEATAQHVLVSAYANHAVAKATAVIGGCKNTASGRYSAVVGGRKNTASGGWSVVGGGGGPADDGSEGNEAVGDYSTVSGGRARSCDDVADWQAGSLWEDD